MTVDTKLREAAESVRQARRHAEFSVRAPRVGTRLGGRLRIAAVAAVVALLSIGIPALVRDAISDGGRTSAGVTDTGQPEPSPASTPTTVAGDEAAGSGDTLLAAPTGFPFLSIGAPGWYPTYTQTTSEGGFAAEVNYERMAEDGSSGLVVLRVQRAAPFDRFADLSAMSASSEEVVVAGRVMALFHIPKESMVEESDSDVHAASWTEGTSARAYAIAFGLDRADFLDVLGGLDPISADAWRELDLMYPVATTTTIVEPVHGG